MKKLILNLMCFSSLVLTGSFVGAEDVKSDIKNNKKVAEELVQSLDKINSINKCINHSTESADLSNQSALCQRVASVQSGIPQSPWHNMGQKYKANSVTKKDAPKQGGNSSAPNTD